MTELVLSPEQSKLLSEAHGPVTIKDQSGRTVAVWDPDDFAQHPLSLTLEEIEEINRRAADRTGPYYTTAEVLERLKSRVQS
jgi:hypothetical protein